MAWTSTDRVTPGTVLGLVAVLEDGDDGAESGDPLSNRLPT